MLGLVCRPEVSNLELVKAGYDHNVLTVPAADNVLRLLPALTITEDDITTAIERLDAAARDVTAANSAGAKDTGAKDKGA
ncbi:MAG: hypothetical protein KDK11_09050, partial [Maritimibacter sp.]|nr:hypothetical protein [Maritimibacter sp.]